MCTYRKRLKDGSFISTTRSVNDNIFPYKMKKGCVISNVISSGVMFKPLGPNKCLFTIVTVLDIKLYIPAFVIKGALKNKTEEIFNMSKWMDKAKKEGNFPKKRII